MEWIHIYDLALKFALNAVMAFLAIDIIYRRFNKDSAHTFILYSFNLILFLIAALLSKAKLSVGSGFGLFAVFTMIRYRSEQLNAKEIAYLLLMASLALINTIASQYMPMPVIALLNAMALGLIVLLEYRSMRPVATQNIKYDKTDLLEPQCRDYPLKDLTLRLGKVVEEINIENINFIDGLANLKIRTGDDYFPPEGTLYGTLVKHHQDELKQLLRENMVKFPINSSLN